MNKKGKVKSIIFEVTMEGHGVVNNDGPDQQYMLNRMQGQEHMKGRYKNVMFAKKNFYEGKDGNITSKVKISSGSLRKHVFNDEVFAQSPNITHSPSVLASFIASPSGLVRGYLFAEKSGTYKRNGAISITDAEQTNNALSYMETCSKSGEKISDEELSDNTFFKKETVGEIEYAAKGSIDLKQLRFVSADVLYDRYAFNPDNFDIYKKFLQMRVPSFNSNLGYYSMEGSVVDLPEYGFKLSNEDLVALVNNTIKRIYTLRINKAGGYASTSKLRYKLVYDHLEDRFSKSEGWKEYNGEHIAFDAEEFYTLFDEQKAKAARQVVEDSRKSSTDKKKADQKEKKEIAKAEKAKKDAAKKKGSSDKEAQ